ncbi:MAG: DUF2726 domain-containing protein [Bacilli bacterium]|nr:DUF2726 domain-containing protein [Bacilli bacterium]
MKDLIILGIIIFTIGAILKLLNDKLFGNNQTNNNNNKNPTYSRKKLMTDSEYNFYLKIKDLEQYYNIVPQVNLATIINKQSEDKFRNELFRNIDFAIFTKDYSTTLLLIELNDATHANSSRKKRDEKVEAICKMSDIPLIKFYTKYPNEREYVVNRILKEINTKYNNTPPLQENIQEKTQ